MIRCSNIVTAQILAPVLLLYYCCGADADVLTDHDNGPLTGIFGFPESTEGGEVIGRGQHVWGTSIITASHNIVETRGGEDFTLDGETTRIKLSYRHGLSEIFDIGIEVPYLSHQSGFLDSIVDGWHDFFGLPNGPRGTRERNQLQFLYSDPNVTLVDITNSTSGVGDIRLLAGWQLAKTNSRKTALQIGIKLPTGESETLLGSGGTDVSLGLAVDVLGLWGKSKLSGMYRANVTYLGKPDRLADRYNSVVGQLSFGLGYHAHQNVDLRIQSRIRSAVYDSEIENLGNASVSLTFGADFHVADRYRLALSVGEDIAPGSAPDVSFQISLRYTGHQ